MLPKHKSIELLPGRKDNDVRGHYFKTLEILEDKISGRGPFTLYIRGEIPARSMVEREDRIPMWKGDYELLNINDFAERIIGSTIISTAYAFQQAYYKHIFIDKKRDYYFKEKPILNFIIKRKEKSLTSGKEHHNSAIYEENLHIALKTLDEVMVKKDFIKNGVKLSIKLPSGEESKELINSHEIGLIHEEVEKPFAYVPIYALEALDIFSATIGNILKALGR